MFFAPKAYKGTPRGRKHAKYIKNNGHISRDISIILFAIFLDFKISYYVWSCHFIDSLTADVKTSAVIFLLLFGKHFFHSAHIRSERNGNIYTSVCIEVVLEECNKHSGRSNNCIVKSMCKVLFCLALDSD